MPIRFSASGHNYRRRRLPSIRIEAPISFSALATIRHVKPQPIFYNWLINSVKKIPPMKWIQSLFIYFICWGGVGGSSSSCEEWTWWTCVWREEKEAASPVCCYIWKRTSSFNFLIYLILLCYWDPFSRNHNITVTNSLVHVHLQLLYLSNIYSIYYQYRVCVYICNKDPPDDIRNYVYCSIDAFIFYSVSDLSNGDS